MDQQPRKILIIDDEEILVKTFSRLLKKSGYEVEAASSGEDARLKVREHTFDLILSDMRLPGENGVEINRSIRQYLEEAKRELIPVIFLTGFADKSIEAMAQELNPVAYIYKPFDAFQLLEQIKDYFKNSSRNKIS